MPLAQNATPIRYVGHNLVFPRYVRLRHPLRTFAEWLLAELGVQADISFDATETGVSYARQGRVSG